VRPEAEPAPTTAAATTPAKVRFLDGPAGGHTVEDGRVEIWVAVLGGVVRVLPDRHDQAAGDLLLRVRRGGGAWLKYRRVTHRDAPAYQWIKDPPL
jgi:hypothetical protein